MGLGRLRDCVHRATKGGFVRLFRRRSAQALRTAARSLHRHLSRRQSSPFPARVSRVGTGDGGVGRSNRNNGLGDFCPILVPGIPLSVGRATRARANASHWFAWRGLLGAHVFAAQERPLFDRALFGREGGGRVWGGDELYGHGAARRQHCLGHPARQNSARARRHAAFFGRGPRHLCLFPAFGGCLDLRRTPTAERFLSLVSRCLRAPCLAAARHVVFGLRGRVQRQANGRRLPLHDPLGTQYRFGGQRGPESMVDPQARAAGCRLIYFARVCGVGSADGLLLLASKPARLAGRLCAPPSFGQEQKPTTPSKESP